MALLEYTKDIRPWICGDITDPKNKYDCAVRSLSQIVNDFGVIEYNINDLCISIYNDWSNIGQIRSDLKRRIKYINKLLTINEQNIATLNKYESFYSEGIQDLLTKSNPTQIFIRKNIIPEGVLNSLFEIGKELDPGLNKIKKKIAELIGIDYTDPGLYDKLIFIRSKFLIEYLKEKIKHYKNLEPILKVKDDKLKSNAIPRPVDGYIFVLIVYILFVDKGAFPFLNLKNRKSFKEAVVLFINKYSVDYDLKASFVDGDKVSKIYMIDQNLVNLIVTSIIKPEISESTIDKYCRESKPMHISNKSELDDNIAEVRNIFIQKLPGYPDLINRTLPTAKRIIINILSRSVR